MQTINWEEEQELISANRQRRENAVKWEELKQFVWNSRKLEFMGGDARSWGLTIGYYAAFYTVLIAFLGVNLWFFGLTADEIQPRWKGMESPLKNLTSLSYRPFPDFETNFMRFIQGQPHTYKIMTDHLQTFLDQYENEKQTGENFIGCESGKPPNQEDKVCRFNLDILGARCTWQQAYGYDEGMPCLLFKLNKIVGWRPDTYESLDELPEEVRPLLADRFKPGYIPITCEGRYPLDKENIGNITFYPPEGFPAYFWPYKNQEGFRSPLVMAQFEHPSNGILIHVVCKAWARNIRHHLNDMIGLAQFQLLVD